VAQHQALIARIGYTWWGWWKKSEEPDRTPDLERLKAQLETGGVEIGLFDKSDDRFYKAYVSECVFGKASVRVTSPMPRATPLYYRKEKLPGWFKITRIEALAVHDPDYGRLFRSIPIGNETFFRLPDSGDKTPVHEDRPDLAPRSIRVKGRQLLHLSDVHFGEYAFPASSGPGQYPLDEILLTDLQKIGAEIGVMVLSGDFTTRADANRLFSEALPFLRKLTDGLALSVDQVVMVPGNHDIPLRDHDPLNYKHEEAYLTFLREFYGRKVEIMRLNRYELENGQPLEILSMNSVRLRAPSQKQYGYVEWPLYRSLLESAPTVDPATLRIAVLHHHLVPASTEEIVDPQYPEAAMSMTLDSGSIVEGLQRYGFKVALNGHQHIPRLTKIARGRLKDDSFDLAGLDDPLHVLGGGSAGTSRLFPEMRDNTYNLLSIDNGEKQTRIEIRIRRFNSGTQPRDHVRHTLSL
jgi:predicted MPP superfamily phosphohydrolase